MRSCEMCGSHMSPFQPRKRIETGEMACKGCQQRHGSLEPVVAHDSGDGETLYHCFSGDTRYVTREGVKTLAETVGTVQQVLTADPTSRKGRWVEAMIHSFGEQSLRRVTLRRNKRKKVVYATAGHQWLVRYSSDRFGSKETDRLKKGDRLPAALPPQIEVSRSDEGVRHGIVYGDGTVTGTNSSNVSLWGEKDKQLIPFFSDLPHYRSSPIQTVGGVHGVRVSAKMPASYKTVPLTDDPDYLYGWLAGYFAADGNVTKQGQAILDSANLGSLEAVQEVALRLGIATYGITSRMRMGFGKMRPLHRVEFVGSTLSEDFFLIEEHRDRYRFRKATYERLGWTVVSVEGTDRVEEVYCPRVPGTESFVLEDWLHTKQCPFCGGGSLVGRSDGTAECGFCHTSFTVQVQPERSAVPQTINGVPYDDPNLPGQPGSPAPTEQPVVPGAETPLAPDEQTDNAIFASRKRAVPGYYLTVDGVALDERSFLRHLAITHADNKVAVIAAVRAERDQA